jgi:hypothetical protein
VSYFDAVVSKELFLRKAKLTIEYQGLDQPIIGIANYFFDSIPTDLFAIKGSRIFSCSLSLESDTNPEGLSPRDLIELIEVKYHHSPTIEPFYENAIINEILEDYKRLLSDTYLFFPELAMHCIKNIQQLSKQGLFLISMDKGFHELQDLEGRKEPDLVKHGSFSIWVNFHALASLCRKLGGKAMLPSYSSFHLDLGTMLFLDDADSFYHTEEAHKKSVDDFGPDDFNSIKKLTYYNITTLNTKDLLSLLRLSVYDSTFFIKLLPRLKQASKKITLMERRRIAETMHIIWNRYFSIGEEYDLAYEIAGFFYDLGFYEDALIYFNHSVELHGVKPDILYNKALSYYQLRQDKRFNEMLVEGKKTFPNHEIFKTLEKLDLN